MRVLIDATAIPADRGGVGRYLDALLAVLPHVAPDIDWHVACQDRDESQFRALGIEPHTMSKPTRPARLIWEQTGLPQLVRRLKADVLHAPHYTLPLACPIPVVVTVHDATFFTDPQWHQPVKARFFRTWTRVSARRATGLIVPSQATAEALRRVVPRMPTITVAPHGVDASTFRPPTEAETAALRQRLGLSSRYVAFLGTIEPRKNVPNLVRGWVAAVKDRDDPPALVLAGGMGWDETVEPAIAAVPQQLRLIRTGYVPLDDLHTLLGSADVVAYPSLGEGFGLPVLEAMSCGAAVLTTKATALPEVGGDAVAYTGSSAAEIGASLTALLDDPAWRAQLGTAAQERAADFTWARSAERHVDAYRKAAS